MDIIAKLQDLSTRISKRHGPYTWEQINTALFDGLHMAPKNITKVLFALPKRRTGETFTWEEINTALVNLMYPVPRIMKVLSALKWV